VKKVLVFGFICGALAVIVFHQGTVWVLHHQFPLIKAVTGAADAFRPASQGFSLRPVPPLGVPQVLSMAFWGGLWGILLAALIRWVRIPDLMGGFVIGLLATLVAFTVVAQMKGLPMWGGGNSITIWRAVLLNGAWGWGTAMLLRPFVLRGD
jgi:hypothetical protein